MINVNNRVKLKSNNIYVEAEPPADRSRPLEWRRSINIIDVDAKRFVVKEHHTICELDYATSGLSRVGLKAAADDHKSDEEKELIKPKSGLRTVISSQIPLEEIRDSIYRVVEEDKEEKIYSFSRAKGCLDLSINDDEPLKESRAIFSAGTHYGSAWIDEDEEKLTVYVSVGKDVLKHLVSEIKSGRVAEIQFRIAVDSFSYEVDDFLREWYHPRDLVIDGRMAHAALESFSVVSKEYAQSPLMISLSEPDDEQSEIEPQAQQYQPQINNVIDEKLLKSIKTALWVIAGALVMIWFGGR